MGSLQKYKLKKVSCEKIEGTIGRSSSDQFFTNLLMQLNKEIANLPNSKKTALFESVPFWLVHELKEEKRTLCSKVEQYR